MTVADINPKSIEYAEYRSAVRELCAGFDGAYWRTLDERAEYPEAFVKALTDAGWLSALIPEQYGGGGLGVTEASVILEEINRSGANSGACHAQMYVMGTLVRHGSEAQKRFYLPEIAAGRLRLQSFAITEPTTGTDTTKTKTVAVRRGDTYIVNGQKVWISRIQHSDLMLLLARTTPLAEVKKKTDGLSFFLVDLRGAERRGMTVRPIRNMVNHETNEVFFEDFAVPAENLVGQEGQGFRYLLDGINAERILIAAECIGDGYWFVDKARRYANERVVFDRPIGQNQGIQFPLARAYANILAADLMRYEAARLFDTGAGAGPAANIAKLLAADASWEAANACLQTLGGFGFAAEYDCEPRSF
jgi:acyl-CoA dehydrogenase